MSAQQPQHEKYGFIKTLSVPYAEAVEKTRTGPVVQIVLILIEIAIDTKTSISKLNAGDHGEVAGVFAAFSRRAGRIGLFWRR